LEGVRILFELAEFVFRARFRRDGNTNGASDCEGAHGACRVEQITESLAEEECGRDHAEAFSADVARSGAAKLRFDTDGEDRLAHGIDCELRLGTDFEILEAVRFGFALGAKLQIGSAKC